MRSAMLSGLQRERLVRQENHCYCDGEFVSLRCCGRPVVEMRLFQTLQRWWAVFCHKVCSSGSNSAIVEELLTDLRNDELGMTAMRASGVEL